MIDGINLSKNAKRAAYAHISFNIIGVAVMLPLFFPSMELLQWSMQWFGGDPTVAVLVNGKETFPLVPVAVGIYSTAFNIFNTVLMFPFIEVFYRVLSKVGHTLADDKEDYSQAKYLDQALLKDMARGVPAVQKEMARYLEGAALFFDIARERPEAPESGKHALALDGLSQDIRQYTAHMFDAQLPYDKANLIASLIEEEDWVARLGNTLHQMARRIERQPFTPRGRELVSATVDVVAEGFRAILPATQDMPDVSPKAEPRLKALAELRERCLRLGSELPWPERGAILTLLGSAESAFYEIERIDIERRSVSRFVRPNLSTGAIRPVFEGPGQAIPATT